MGRPGVYGRELIVAENGDFLACNIGYNFYAEHEAGTASIVEGMNRTVMQSLDYSMSFREIGKRKKAIKNGIKKMKRFESTPYGAFVLHPCVDVYKHEIKIRKECAGGIMPKGDYSVLQIGFRAYTLQDLINRKGNDICEADLMYMPDYRGGASIQNFGFMKSILKGNIIYRNANVFGSWMDGGTFPVRVYINRGEHFRDIGSQIVSALKNGSLAIVPELPGICSDRGCILCDLDALYMPR